MANIAQVESQFCRQVSRVGNFRAAEIAKVLTSSVDLDLGHPTFIVLVPRNPKKTGSVALSWARLVLRVDRRRNVTQVGYPIVALVAVEMVDLLFGPHAVKMQISEAVGKEFFAIDHDADVTIVVERPRDYACFDITARLHPPVKDSSLRLVVQQASQRVHLCRQAVNLFAQCCYVS